MNPLSQQSRVKLKNGDIIDSCIDDGKRKMHPRFAEDIEANCKRHLVELSGSRVDFKDRLAFVRLFNDDRTGIFKRHFRHASDLIAYYNQLDYDRIDDVDFRWEL